MVNSDYTAVLLIVDRSGSMVTIREDIEGGLQEFVAKQAELPGKITFDYVRFDTEFEYVEKFASADEFRPTVDPRGGTALHDAIGRGTREFGQSLADLEEDERPGNVLVVIATDGHENASREFTGQAVKSLIAHQKSKYSWDFVFLGANQDAVQAAGVYGINRGSSLTYAASASGVKGMAASLGAYTTATRSGVNYNFTEEDREAASK